MTDDTLGGENRPTHLDYYIEHGISPVRQDIGDLDGHFERRSSLYRTLGVLPLMLRNSSVLEVAPGSGHNSLYIACCHPRAYTLVEPNPAGIRDIKALYQRLDPPHTAPTLFETKLEDFQSAERFDVAVCENWLGSAAHERALLRKLAGFVAPGGVLVITTVSPLGLLANLLRNALAARVADRALPFDRRAELLLAAFSPHLATMPAMTRPHLDWVHDNVMNPAYFGVCLTARMVVEDIGDHFEFFRSCPDITEDWRWYKALHGTGRNFNGHFLAEYDQVCHNFIDHRSVLPRRDGAANARLETIAWMILDAVRAYWFGESTDQGPVLTAVKEFMRDGADLPPAIHTALAEFCELFAKPSLRAEDVAGMSAFGGLFGRESIFLSFHRSR